MDTPRTSQREYLLIALAILLGSLIMWGAVQLKTESATGTEGIVELSRSSRTAHVYGNARAPIRIVEFSDYSCGFCGRLHPTLKQIVDQSAGKISWEYRHFPILRELSTTAALVSECVAREVGNDAFWSYTDTILENQSLMTDAYLRQVAVDNGLMLTELDVCLSEPMITTLVDTDGATARALGARGTPYSMVIFADGTSQSVSGALPYEEWMKVINRSE
jgi:protein-disulfide isomerase